MPSTRTERRAPISTEFELKLAAPAAKLEKLKRVLLACASRARNLHRLSRPKISLRRTCWRGGSGKTKSRASGRFSMHRDWQEAARWVSDEELRPAFTTVVTVIEISPDPSARIEADIDEGEIRASKGDAVVPITEIELELKKGDPRMLFDVALQLLEAAPIRIQTCSKAERGYRLLESDGLMPQAVRGEPVALDPTMSVEAAIERIGRRCLTHLLGNEQAALAGEPEGIHQMRVVILRLLMDQLREATDPDARAIDRSGGVVLGTKRGLADYNPKLRKHVRRFRRLDPFW